MQRAISAHRLILVVLTACLLDGREALAEPLADRLLAGVKVAERNDCAIVKIDFNTRVQYTSHFPLQPSDEVRIQVLPLDPSSGNLPLSIKQESLRAPQSERAAIYAIELQPDGKAAKLIVNFTRTVSVKVAQGVDFKSVLIAVARPGKGADACQPAQNAFSSNEIAAPQGWKNSITIATPQAAGGTDKLMADAREALANSKPDRAVQFLTKLLETPAAPQRQEAQELLGVARELRGQTAHALAEYREYLRLYPTGSSADRVRARIAAIEAGAPAPVGAAIPGIAVTSQQQIKLDDGGKSRQNAIPVDIANGRMLADPPKSPNEWTVSKFASISTYYNMNQGGQGFIELPRTNVGWDAENPYKTYQSAFLTSADVDMRFERGSYAGRFRFSGTEENDVGGGARNPSLASISSLYLESNFKDYAISNRVGRQTSSSDGVLGRFDGALASYQANETTKYNVVAGSPVLRSYDQPFINEQYFYGLSVNKSFFGRTLETSTYYFQQFANSMNDRQSIGSEVRYVKDGFATFGAADYDIHFNQINSSVLTANKIFADQSSASINLDYRRAPTLLLTNALQGQGVFKLSDLLLRYTGSEITQLALDRTAQSFTATGTYSRPLNANLQWSSDVTVNHLGGMPASGGIDLVPASGTAYYLSTQLNASNFYVDKMTGTSGLRFADTPTSDRYMANFGVGYALTKDVRLNPSLILGYGIYKGETRHDYQVMPSIRTSYAVRPDMQLELELGSKSTWSYSPTATTFQRDLLILVGARYDFSDKK